MVLREHWANRSLPYVKASARRGVKLRQLEPSGVSTIAISARTPSSPTTRSTQPPSTGPSPYSLSPSSPKNAVAAVRSSTTMPTCSMRWIVMRWTVRHGGPSYNVPRLPIGWWERAAHWSEETSDELLGSIGS